VFYSNIVPKAEIFDFKYVVTLKTGLGSLKMSPFDSAHMTSYLRSILNMALISCRFWGIQCRKISRPWNSGQGSIRVIENGTIR